MKIIFSFFVLSIFISAVLSSHSLRKLKKSNKQDETRYIVPSGLKVLNENSKSEISSVFCDVTDGYYDRVTKEMHLKCNENGVRDKKIDRTNFKFFSTGSGGQVFLLIKKNN